MLMDKTLAEQLAFVTGHRPPAGGAVNGKAARTVETTSPSNLTPLPPTDDDAPPRQAGGSASHEAERDEPRTANASWPEPQPLNEKIPPEPYPLDALPTTILDAVTEVAGFVKAPLPMVASSALAALSLAGQAQVDVMRAQKLTGPTGLFLLTIADSGERKSTCDGFFFKAIRDYEAEQAESAKPGQTRCRADLSAWEAKHSGIRDKIRLLAKSGKETVDLETALRVLEQAKPEPPRIPRMIRTDATPEALAWGLSKQWPSAGLVSAEAGIVLGSHGMNKDTIMRNLGLLNLLWDGLELAVDRRTSESFTVRGARLTVALQVQEPTLREFFARSGELARGTGFLARFLVSWPESTQGHRPFTEAPENWPHLAAFNQRLTALLQQPVLINENGALTPKMLAMTPQAKESWVEYHDTVEAELANGGELCGIRDVASKTADNAARLAALFHLFDGAGDEIGKDAFEGASRITAWHLYEARRFFRELALSPEVADANLLDCWLIDFCRKNKVPAVRRSHVLTHGPNSLRNKAKLDTALEFLAELARARQMKIDKQAMLCVNPKLLSEGEP